MAEHQDYPLMEVVEQAVQRIADCATKNIEMHIFQKWTCSHCNARQTMTKMDTFFTSGKCEECNQITQIENCNYLATLTSSLKAEPVERPVDKVLKPKEPIRRDANGNKIPWDEEHDYFMAFDPNNPDMPTD